MGPNREIVYPRIDSVVYSSDHRAIPVLSLAQCLGDTSASFGRSSGGFYYNKKIATNDDLYCRWPRHKRDAVDANSCDQFYLCIRERESLAIKSGYAGPASVGISISIQHRKCIYKWLWYLVLACGSFFTTSTARNTDTTTPRIDFAGSIPTFPPTIASERKRR